ncbi:unnamed protein product, partial [Mesorhabditis belari]|uniref:Apple domain-containing protein n=1 Tax=Mesorhabditis belari TaxID=2138241 RepID=A0AAF3FI09_9BILA
MSRSLFLLILAPTLALAAIQCYVGQKLFALESNMAVCAPFVPYHCAIACEWKHNCSSTVGYEAFSGRRTFVSGLLINSKSLMALCCTSFATKIESDNRGERCAWRDWDSIPVLGPSIRAEPVLGVNHYIRDIEMERDGDSRVDARIEVCQYQKEMDSCQAEKLEEAEQHRLNLLKLRLERFQSKYDLQKENQAPKIEEPVVSH